VRATAITCLNRILTRGVKADLALEQAGHGAPVRERGLLCELVYGVLRRRYSLEADFSRFCNSKPDEVSAAALLLGSYQLRHMRVPAHAAVSETVTAVRQLNPKAAGFVNAVLRRVADSAAPIRLKPYQRAELPRWIYSRWRDAFGADAVQQFSDALKVPPPLCVALFEARDAWIDEVRACGIKAVAGVLSPYAVLLPAGTMVTALPGFERGAFAVMDQAAQAAVLALQPARSDGLIIDLCAAPGGKTALLAHCFPQARIVAVELSSRRMPRLRENLQRLQCGNVEIVQADALALPFADSCADALMLDAPCSASGILRRHPDAKFLHDARDVETLAAAQRRMLKRARRLLKPGASMVYAVCSIHPEENEQVVAGIDGVIDQQRRLPDTTHDGFFHAVVERTA